MTVTMIAIAGNLADQDTIQTWIDVTGPTAIHFVQITTSFAYIFWS